jgi:hypothetical protein
LSIKSRKPGSYSVADVWENRKVARVVALYLSGRSTVQIAEELHDGTSASTIGVMLREWAIEKPAEPFCKVPLTIRSRAHLGWRAGRRGLTPEQYLAKIVDKIMKDNLADAILGDDD